MTEKKLEDLEKIYLKNKFPREPDVNFNGLNISVKEFSKQADYYENEKRKSEEEELKNENNSLFSYPDQTIISKNYESVILINADIDKQEGRNSNDEQICKPNVEEFVNLKYNTPLSKISSKVTIYKYLSIFLSCLLVLYMGYHSFYLTNLKLINEDNNKKQLVEYYKNNSDNLIFSNETITVFIYLIGVFVIIYNCFIHIKISNINIQFYELDYELNQKYKNKCQKARIYYIIFGVIFCIGNIFQLANFNYYKEFYRLANNEPTETESNLKESIELMNAWRYYFSFLIIAVNSIKIMLCFTNIWTLKKLIIYKFEQSKMYFELKSNIF